MMTWEALCLGSGLEVSARQNARQADTQELTIREVPREGVNGPSEICFLYSEEGSARCSLHAPQIWEGKKQMGEQQTFGGSVKY